MAASMAKEGRLRKLHRRGWPSFLSRVVQPRVWQVFGSHIEPASDPRIRWSPKYIVLCWIMMGWSIQGQLTERFGEAHRVLTGLFASRRRPGRSYQGMVKATLRVGEAVFHQWWSCLRTGIPKHLQGTWHWYGWVAMAVDGSRVDAPRTVRNEKELGIAGREKTHPQYWITWIVHLPSHILWDWRQGPGRSSERAHLREMISDLPQKTLLVGDIGFGGFDLLSRLLRANVDFLIRCGGGTTTLLVNEAVQKIVRRGEACCVYLWPLNRRRCPPLCLRLIVLKRNGKRVYLVTNVTDSTRLSRRMAGEMYQARWGIEVGYRSLKQTLGRRKLLARTPEAATMELAGNILGLSLLMLHAAVALRAKVAHVSVAKALRVIRQAIAAICFRLPFTPFLDRLRAALRDTYERKRSKRHRDWPDKKKERPPGPPKFRRLTRKEKTKIPALLQKSIVFG